MTFYINSLNYNEIIILRYNILIDAYIDYKEMMKA